MKITKVIGPSTYTLTLSESEILILQRALIAFWEPFGIKNGYQDLAKEMSTTIAQKL